MPSLDLDRVKQLTEYTFLELQASILYQQCWNSLDVPKVLQDLMDNEQLWSSFAMKHQYFETDKEGFMLSFLIDELWQQARWNRQKPHAYTLYLYAANNQEETVSRLVEFGKEWCCDLVTVCDGIKPLEECNIGWQLFAYTRLHKEDTVIVEYWGTNSVLFPITHLMAR